VTEAEWLKCQDPLKMLEFLGDKASQRKLRLFACASCRGVWKRINERPLQRAVELAEAAADGRPVPVKFPYVTAWRTYWRSQSRRKRELLAAYGTTYEDAFRAAQTAVEQGLGNADLLREVMGNPFRTSAINSAWLGFQGGVIQKRARQAYDNRIMPAGTLDRATGGPG
jgi:hypothetical protein